LTNECLGMAKGAESLEPNRECAEFGRRIHERPSAQTSFAEPVALGRPRVFYGSLARERIRFRRLVLVWEVSEPEEIAGRVGYP
jgi:hypothetical protein